MSMSSSISRLIVYFRRNGLRATARRVSLAARRALFSSRMVLFYCDLLGISSPAEDLPKSLKIEQHRSPTGLGPGDLEEMTSFWNPQLACRKIQERFALGASLWLIRCEDKLAGYGWTLRGRTVEPHYFLLGPDDVHLFDFHIFPEYRGRRLNPLLVTHILHNLAAEYEGRAFIEAAEWNLPQLSSLSKTPFRHLGSARKFTVFGQTIGWWARGGAVELQHKFKKVLLSLRGNTQPNTPDVRA
jgi:hypothetical protein